MYIYVFICMGVYVYIYMCVLACVCACYVYVCVCMCMFYCLFIHYLHTIPFVSYSIVFIAVFNLVLASSGLTQ